MVSTINTTHSWSLQKIALVMVSEITYTYGHCQKDHSLMVIAKNTTHSCIQAPTLLMICW